MKRIEMVENLIKDGFSEKTLVNMSDKQLKLLSDRIISEQQNNNVNVSGDTPNLTAIVTKLKQSGNNVTVSEESEMNEQDVSDAQVLGALGLVLGAFGAAAFNSGKHYYTQYLQAHPEDKKGAVKHALMKIVKDAHSSGGGIAEQKSEATQLQEWVDLLVENEYNSVTTKNEIMDLIRTKLQEQGREIEIADPDTETEVEPDIDTPQIAPDEDPYIDPWKEPGTSPDPRPKFKHDNLPDFLKFNNIVGSVNETNVATITNMVLNQLKTKSKNGK